MTFLARSPKRIVLLAATAVLATAIATRIPLDSAVPATSITADEAPALRRLTETQYRATIADIFGPDFKITGRIEPDLRVDGLIGAGTGVVSITSGGAEQYATIARGIAEQVIAPANRERLVGCAPGAGDADGRQCAERFFARMGQRLFRRPLTKNELDLAVANTLDAASQLSSFDKGLATALGGMLVDLPFLFQVDNYVADPVRRGGLTLDGWSRASRLSYFLWNTTPDEELLRAASTGELMTPTGLEKQVQRLLASPRFEEGARAFFDDFFRLEGATKLVKDPVIYPGFRSTAAAAAREQTLRTTIELLIREKGDYRELFTTRRVAMNRVLSPLYRMPHPSLDWEMIEFPADDPRAGLLTQISFLTLHSHEGRSSPTLRGLAIREILMCEHVAPPPANVNFTIVQDTGNPLFKTTRDRLKAHLDDEECASCHKKTDGIGLTFEKFDGAGQFRATEAGAMIDTSGDLDDVKITDPVSLGKALADHPATTRCLTQSAWRSASGRPLLSNEQPLIDRLNRAFAAGGYQIGKLFYTITTSPEFFAGTSSRMRAQRTAQASSATKTRSF